MNNHVLVIGAGYLGLPIAACIAAGHMRAVPEHVRLIDISADRIESIREFMLGNGEDPLGEPFLDATLDDAAQRLRLFASNSETLQDHILWADVIFVCVGTPGLKICDLDDHRTGLISDNISQIAEIVVDVANRSGVTKYLAVRSTCPPHQMEMIADLIESNTDHVLFAHIPEFLREGHAVNDVMVPSRVVVGSRHSEPDIAAMVSYVIPGDAFEPASAPSPDDKPVVRVMHMLPGEAALVKLGSNTLLAQRVAFAYRMASLTEAVSEHANYRRVLAGIAADDRIGSGGLLPGLGPAGPCLVKDSYHLCHMSDRSAFEPIANALKDSANNLANRVVSSEGSNIIFCGVGFKPDSDDWRNSNMVEVVIGVLMRLVISGSTDRRVQIWSRHSSDEDVIDLNRHLKSEVVYRVGQNNMDVSFSSILDDIVFCDYSEDPDPYDIVVVGTVLPPSFIVRLMSGDGRKTVLDPFLLVKDFHVRAMKARGIRYWGLGVGEQYPKTPWVRR